MHMYMCMYVRERDMCERELGQAPDAGHIQRPDKRPPLETTEFWHLKAHLVQWQCCLVCFSDVRTLCGTLSQTTSDDSQWPERDTVVKVCA